MGQLEGVSCIQGPDFLHKFFPEAQFAQNPHMCVCLFVSTVCTYICIYLCMPLCSATTVLKCPMSIVELVAKWGLVDMTRHDAQRSR